MSFQRRIPVLANLSIGDSSSTNLVLAKLSTKPSSIQPTVVLKFVCRSDSVSNLRSKYWIVHKFVNAPNLLLTSV
jgi:hypothetical protein